MWSLSGNKKDNVVITSKVLRSAPWFSLQLRNIWVTNDHGYVPIDCRNHFPVLSSFITYQRICNWRNTTGTVYTSGELSSLPVFNGVTLSFLLPDNDHITCITYYCHWCGLNEDLICVILVMSPFRKLHLWGNIRFV
jgi:hypothetical protein